MSNGYTPASSRRKRSGPVTGLVLGARARRPAAAGRGRRPGRRLLGVHRTQRGRACTSAAARSRTRRFKGCVPAGTHQNLNSPGDTYVTYSTSQRDWDATGQGGADAAPFKVVSSDNVEMQIPIIVRFYQITDCRTLEKFYDNLGQRYGAYITKDGGGSAGWETMVRKIVADPVDVELGRIAQKYALDRGPQRPRRCAPRSRRASGPTSPSLVERNAQGHYFDRFSVLVKKPEPTDPNLMKKINDAQAAIYAAAGGEGDRRRATPGGPGPGGGVAQAESAKNVADILGFKLPGMTNRRRSCLQRALPDQPAATPTSPAAGCCSSSRPTSPAGSSARGSPAPSRPASRTA